MYYSTTSTGLISKLISASIAERNIQEVPHFHQQLSLVSDHRTQFELTAAQLETVGLLLPPFDSISKLFNSLRFIIFVTPPFSHAAHRFGVFWGFLAGGMGMLSGI